METITIVVVSVTAFATVLLAIFTGFYVSFTHKLAKGTNELLKETKRMVDQMNMSDVAVFLKNERPKPNINIYFQIHFCVKNAGTHTVRKVRFEGDLSFNPKDKNTPIGDILWVKNGIDVLLPGEMRSHIIFTASCPNEQKTFYDISDTKAHIKPTFRSSFFVF